MSTWRPIRASCSSMRARKPVTPYPPDSAPSHALQEFTSFAEIVQGGSAALAAGGEGVANTVSSERPTVRARTVATSRGENDLPGLMPS